MYVGFANWIYSWRFTGANRPFVPNFPGAAAPALPAPVGALVAPPIPSKFTRSGRTYG